MPAKITPGGGLRQKQTRQKDRKYLLFIKNLPCILCLLRGGLNRPCDAAHVRYGDPEHKKRSTGAGEKPDDKWCVPLCAEHHRGSNEAQHHHGEREWWSNMNIDPVALCKLLYEARADEQQCISHMRQVAARARQEPSKKGEANA